MSFLSHPECCFAAGFRHVFSFGGAFDVEKGLRLDSFVVILDFFPYVLHFYLLFAVQVGDLNDFDGAKLAGLWELIYSTSVKPLGVQHMVQHM